MVFYCALTELFLLRDPRKYPPPKPSSPGIRRLLFLAWTASFAPETPVAAAGEATGAAAGAAAGAVTGAAAGAATGAATEVAAGADTGVPAGVNDPVMRF